MKFNNAQMRLSVAITFAALMAVVVAKFVPMAGNSTFSASLWVGTVTGPDKPLAWKDTKVITSGETVRFKWSTTDPNVTARWEVTKAGSVVPVASGAIASVPAPGKETFFNVNFKPFVPASAPAAGINYDVVVKTYPKGRITRTTTPPRIVVRPPGGVRPAPTTNRASTLPEPKSISSKVMVAYVRPGAPTKFDNDMGYSRRQIKIDLHTLHVGDEDDPSSNDEPYAVMVKFRFRTLIGASGKVSVQPGTLQVGAVGTSCHNNMGHSDDNWSDEDDGPYNIRNAGLSILEYVPTGQMGWVVGAVVVMFEEDAFTYETASLMRDKIIQEARKSIETLNFSNVNPNSISDAVEKKIVGQIKGSFKYFIFGLGDLFSGLAQAADPDDIAGFNTVIAFTAPGGQLAMTSGQPPASANDLITQAVPITGSRGFTLEYPIGNLSAAPGIARYQGRMSLEGTVTTRLYR